MVSLSHYLSSLPESLSIFPGGPFAQDFGSFTGLNQMRRRSLIDAMGGDRMPFCTLRAWVLYESAWIPYAASYYLIFRLQNPSNPNALTDALINVLPAAILGILVLSITQRWKWPPTGRALFFVSHGTAAVCYAALWWIAVELLGAAFSLIVDHRWQFIPWGMYAAQWQAFSGLMIYGNLVGFAYVMQAQQRAAEEEQRRIQAETLRVQSDLNALRSQLNPHFLFNTLNSVIALVQNEPAKAERALVDDGNQTPRKQSGCRTGIRLQLAGNSRERGPCDRSVNSSCS